MTGLNIAALKEESDRLKEGNQGGSDYLNNFVKFPEGAGAVVVRLLGPASSGMFNRKESHFFQSTRTHQVNNKSLHCLKTLHGHKFEGDCPLCAYYTWLWQESERKGPEEAAKLQAQARAIKPIERYYYNCIVRKELDSAGEAHTDVGPKILSVGKILHKKIVAAIVGSEEMDEPALGDVTHFKTGRDFKIIKTIRPSGDQNYPNYDTSKFLEVSAVAPDQAKVWMENLHDLTLLRHVLEPDQLKTELKKHLGLIPDAGGTNFDPSEYKMPLNENVVVQKSETKTPKATEEAEVSDDSSDDGVDEDFFNKLRDIG